MRRRIVLFSDISLAVVISTAIGFTIGWHFMESPDDRPAMLLTAAVVILAVAGKIVFHQLRYQIRRRTRG